MTWATTYRRKIRYSDTDAQGIVFNGNYATYFDDTLTDLFDLAGLTADATHVSGYDVVTAHLSIDFRAPGRLGDVLVTGARLARIGSTSLEFALQTWNEASGVVIVEGKVVFVCVDAETLRPVAVPEALVAGMQTVHAGELPSPD